MAIIAGTSIKSMQENIRRSLDSPTPDMKVIRIQVEAFTAMLDIYFNHYEEMAWENLRLRSDLKIERQFNKLGASFESRLQRLESQAHGNTVQSHPTSA